jgi:hypothetical protein
MATGFGETSEQAHSTDSSQVQHPQYKLLLSKETLKIKKHLLSLQPAKSRCNTKEILKTYEEFLYGNVTMLAIHFVKTCKK